MVFHCPVHKKGRFHGWERKNEPAVHENGGFRGQGPGYLLYLYDLVVILSSSEGSMTNEDIN